MSAARGRDGAAVAAPRAPAFDELPGSRIVRAFGVEYAHVSPPAGGDLYLTRLGWPHADALDPACWYEGEWFARQGVKLPGSSGHVYRVRTRPVGGRSVDVVVKFSRVAQDVPVVVATSFAEEVTPEILADARFNSPMEEFGLVMELRRGEYGPRDLRVLTQRPLAIYAPPQRFDLWELGRSTSSFLGHRHLLADDQEQAVHAIELDIRRIYVLIYGWIEGCDAEACYESGDLNEQEFAALTPRVWGEMADKGFRVLDTKPKHFILRRRPDGGLLRRHGKLVYGLVDFELLQRSVEHQHRFKAARREAYWRLQSHGPGAPAPQPSHLKPVTVFGVGYIHGATPDGGHLWVVGRESALFDYFLPDRWRRTPRLKLSGTSDVFRTRTRDLIDVVYRRSRVGFRPRVDPLTEAGRRIREAGYNSPFEEIAIAGRLREMGIATVYPRAIFCTGHETLKPLRLLDPRRFAAHEDQRTPEGPILSPRHDYYTIWDTFRGLDPLNDPAAGGLGGVVGLERAHDDGAISALEMEAALTQARARLAHTPLPADSIADDDFALLLGAGGIPMRDEAGVPQVVLSLDALTAHEYGLIGEDAYRALMERFDERLRAVDCEKLDPNGRHLLLTLDPDGRPRKDASGGLHVTLCNFALIQGLYRPIR